MSLLSYMMRTMLVVIPGVLLIGWGVCFANGITGTHFYVTMIAIIILGSLIGILSSIINHRRFIAPIAEINEFLHKLADGNMKERLDSANVGQLKPIAEALNRTTDIWSDVLNQIERASTEVNLNALQLSNGARQTNMAAVQITEAIEEMAAGAEQQVKGVQDTSAFIFNLADCMEDVAAHSEETLLRINQSAKKADNGSKLLLTARGQMDSICHNVQDLTEIVEELGKRSNEIGSIVEVISGIAAQTNLLALNAAIEAARAGEHGKGFAVVANEVRKLAEISASSTMQISEMITFIQTETNRIVQTMASVNTEIKQGINLMGDAEEAFIEIDHGFQTVTKQMANVVAIIDDIASSSNAAEKHMNDISGATQESAAANQNVLSSTEEQLASMQEIEASSAKLSNMADELKQLMKKFELK